MVMVVVAAEVDRSCPHRSPDMDSESSNTEDEPKSLEDDGGCGSFEDELSGRICRALRFTGCKAVTVSSVLS